MEGRRSPRHLQQLRPSYWSDDAPLPYLQQLKVLRDGSSRANLEGTSRATTVPLVVGWRPCLPIVWTVSNYYPSVFHKLNIFCFQLHKEPDQLRVNVGTMKLKQLTVLLALWLHIITHSLAQLLPMQIAAPIAHLLQ
jgi:hypothetical protein